MVTCWASGMGGCSAKQSGEHYVTRGLWSASEITISGFDWQKDQPRLLPVASLEANILCTTHNSELGEQVDAEAIKIFKTMGEVLADFKSWQANPRQKKPPLPKRYRADGELFERWAAKTLIDFVCVDGKNEIRWHGTDAPALEPPVEIVSAIYGRTKFKHPTGLYLAQENTYEPHTVLEEAIRVDPRFHPEDGGLVGGFLEFRNLRLLVWLVDQPFESFITETRSGATFGEGENPLVYHLDEFKFNFNYVTRHKIAFSW